MIAYLIEVSICWLIFYVVYSLLLSKETFFKINRWYLLSTLVLGLVIPLFAVELINTVFSEPVQSVVLIAEGVSDLEIVIENSVTNAQKADFSWLTLIMIGYIIGVFISFSHFLYGLRQIYQLYQNASIINKRAYKLVLTKTPHLPFSFFNYMFWHESMELATKDSHKIITHEVAHINQWHSLDVLFLELLSVLLWFSPPIYWYKKSLRTIHEYLADAYVLRDTKKKQYGHLLIKQAQSGMQIALANNFIHSQLKKRIEMMTRNKSRRKALMRYLPVLPILLLMVLVFSNKNVQSNLNSTIAKAGMTVDKNKTLPIFPGGEKEMLKFIYTNIKYPVEARTEGVYGLAKVQFTVDKDGIIRNPKLTKGVAGGISEEVFRIVQLMQNLPTKWTPGTIKGKPIAMTYELPINFRLEGGDQTHSEVDKSPTKSTMLVVTGLMADYVKEQPKAIGPIFKEADEMPRFSGCEGRKLTTEELKNCAQDAMLQFIYTNIKYPKKAKEQKIEGVVVARFVVNKDGHITDQEIVRSIGGGTDEVVLEMVGKMPKWIPGKKDGRKANIQIHLPVKFKLQEEKEEQLVKTDENGVSHYTTVNKTTPLPEETINGEPIFKVVEEMPLFPGCEDSEVYSEDLRNCSNEKLINYIVENIKYPEVAKKQGIEGTTVIQFIIEKDGTVSDAKILRNIGGGTGEEALRIVHLMQEQDIRWKPGRQRGKLVNVSFVLPVKFKLEDDAKKEALENTYLTNQPNSILSGLSIKAFPNPASEQVTINFEGEKAPTILTMIDLSGREVYREEFNHAGGLINKTILLNKMPKGTLVIKVQQNGKEAQTKIVVQ